MYCFYSIVNVYFKNSFKPNALKLLKVLKTFSSQNLKCFYFFFLRNLSLITNKKV